MRKYAEYKEHHPDKTDAQIIELLSWELGEKVEEIGRLLVELNGHKALYLEGRELLEQVPDRLNYGDRFAATIREYLTKHKDLT